MSRLGDSRSGREPRGAVVAGVSDPSHSTVVRHRLEPFPELEPAQLGDHPVVRNYVIVCLVAMVILLIVLIYQGLGTGSLIPPLVGIMGVIVRWRSAPLIILGALAGLYYIELFRFHGMAELLGLNRPDLSDVLLAGSMLLYVAGHYRIQSFYHEIIPAERQKAAGRARQGKAAEPTPELSPRRSPGVVSPMELPLLALLPGWAVVALVFWLLLPSRLPVVGDQIHIHPQIWQTGLVVWIVGVGLLVLSTLVNYLGFRRINPAEAYIFLQDAVWRETRREQGRINRWLAWARLRTQRKKETS